MHARQHPADVAGLALIDAVGRDYAAQFPPERYARFRSGLDRLLALSDALAPFGLTRWLGLPASLVAARLPTGTRASAAAWSFSARHYHTLRGENAGFDTVLQQARQLPALPHVPTLVLSSDVMRDFPPDWKMPRCAPPGKPTSKASPRKQACHACCWRAAATTCTSTSPAASSPNSPRRETARRQQAGASR